MTSDQRSSADNPFADRTTSPANPESTDLYVSRNVRLSLSADALVVYGTSPLFSRVVQALMLAQMLPSSTALIAVIPTALVCSQAVGTCRAAQT